MSAYAVDASSSSARTAHGTRRRSMSVRADHEAQLRARRRASASGRAALRWGAWPEDQGGFSEDEEEENDVRVELGEKAGRLQCVSDGDDGGAAAGGGGRRREGRGAGLYNRARPVYRAVLGNAAAAATSGEGDRVLACVLMGP